MHWKIFCVLNLLVKFMFDVCRMVGGTVVSSWEDIVLAPRAPSMFQAKRGATQASHAKNCRIHHVQRIHVTMSRHTQQQMRKIERDQGHGVKIEKNEPADFLFRLKSASLNLNFWRGNCSKTYSQFYVAELQRSCTKHASGHLFTTLWGYNSPFTRGPIISCSWHLSVLERQLWRTNYKSQNLNDRILNWYVISCYFIWARAMPGSCGTLSSQQMCTVYMQGA